MSAVRRKTKRRRVGFCSEEMLARHRSLRSPNPPSLSHVVQSRTRKFETTKKGTVAFHRGEGVIWRDAGAPPLPAFPEHTFTFIKQNVSIKQF
jgi:hypothetical protein